MALAPNYAPTFWWYSEYLFLQRRFDEALAAATRAPVLDPLSQMVGQGVFWTAYFAGRYDEAIAHCRKAIEANARCWFSHLRLGQALLQKGDDRDALEVLERAREISPEDAEAIALLGIARSRIGDVEGAEEALETTIALTRTQYSAPYAVAMLAAALGRRDLAVEWLERAYLERAHSVPYLKVEPLFASLRSDPAIEALIARVGA